MQRQVQNQVATHDATSTELRNFVRRCLVLKQRTTEDIDRLKKHYEKYGYRPRTAPQGNAGITFENVNILLPLLGFCIYLSLIED